MSEVELMTVREVASYLKVDDTTVRRWITGGVLAAVTLPHKGNRNCYRIRRDEFEKILFVQVVARGEAKNG